MSGEHSHVAIVTGPDGVVRVPLVFADIRAGKVLVGSGPACVVRIAGIAETAAIVFEWSKRMFARRVDAPVPVPRTPREGDDELDRRPATFGKSTVSIVELSGTPVVLHVDDRAIDLGDFYEAWATPVTIGSDPSNRVVLAGLPARAATLRAMSNHKMLEVEGQPARRVDHREFQLGPYKIRIG